MFPISSIELVNKAYERVIEQAETVKSQLVSSYLPQTVEVILSRQPECRNLVRGRQDLEAISSDLGKILWSQPGSMGGVHIERNLIDWGFDTNAADVLATNVIQFSRYSMAVVNHLRHIRSAVTSLRDVLVPQLARERFFTRAEVASALEKEWLAYIEKLGARVLEDADDLALWLDDLSIVIATLLRAKNDKKLNVSPSDLYTLANEKVNLGLGPLSMAQAYTRRFGRFVASEFNIEDLGGRYEAKEDSILDELTKLKLELSGDDEAVFALFSADFEKRKSRIKVSTRPPASRSFPRNDKDFSYFENYLSNHLQIDNREVVIRNSSPKISPALIEQITKIFKAQMMVESKMDRFRGKAALDGEELILEVERPSSDDVPKLKRLLKALFE